ncbi:protein downstream neighbor of Son-like [Montipora capricornis]|uniref:protein downstream neighbor of Son-like n=1 Tax=Montipora capricornis TaxID=246305 RepID=UPI0035F219FB
MAQSSPKAAFISPIKPSGVIKLKVKKKKTTVPSSLRISNALKPINGNGLGQDGREQALKRKNPFKCSPRKKPNVTSENKTQDCQLFNALDGLDENLQNSSKGKREMTKKEGDGNTEINKISFIENDVERAGDVDTEKDGLKGSETLPLDWSLKYKIRFTSQKSFNWCGTLKTVEEAEGLSNFARCHVEENENPISLSGYPSSFCSATKVWMHPSLPWLDLFPRKSLNGKPGLKREVQISNEMASSLQKDWVSSFRSLFNLTRTGFCPYFYLVANQNSMLFQAAGLHGEQFVQVFITPTTKGFRDSLRNEGINFTMPHLEEKSKTQSESDFREDSCDVQDKDAPEDDSDDENSDKREWLESMGLDKEQFPLLNPNAITPHEITNLRTIDQQPTSTVLVKGPDTHALFNFLLNCKSLVSNTGVLAQVPPTLLAQVAFDGATLRSLRVNQGIVKHLEAKGMAQLHTIEISGPILPGCVYVLSQLFKASQKGNFKATLSANQPTVAFNVPKRNTNSETVSMGNGSHLQQSLSQGQLKYYQDAEQLNGCCLKELECKGGFFTWTS